MAAVQPLVNGQSYHYTQASCKAWGIDILFTELNYKEAQVKVNNYNNSKYPVGRTYGKVENSTGSITMDKAMYDKLRAIAPSRGALHSLPPTDVTITYARSGQLSTTDIIRGFEFKDNGNEGSTEDDYMVTSFEFIFTLIDRL